MAKLTFETPGGKECHGCMALNTHSFYCKFFEEFLKNEYGNAGCMKCNACMELEKNNEVKANERKISSNL